MSQEGIEQLMLINVASPDSVSGEQTLIPELIGWRERIHKLTDCSLAQRAKFLQKSHPFLTIKNLDFPYILVKKLDNLYCILYYLLQYEIAVGMIEEANNVNRTMQANKGKEASHHLEHHY